MVESSTLTSKGQLLVPKRLREKYGIKPGIRIALVESKEGLILKPMDEAFFDQFRGKYKESAQTTKEYLKWKKRNRKIDKLYI